MPLKPVVCAFAICRKYSAAQKTAPAGRDGSIQRIEDPHDIVSKFVAGAMAMAVMSETLQALCQKG